MAPISPKRKKFSLMRRFSCWKIPDIAKQRPVFMPLVKLMPELKTEAEEREFWETHDSSDYLDWSQAKPASLPKLKPSTKTISLRLPETLLNRIKIEANKRDMPYQSLIKAWLADEVNGNCRA